MINQSNFFNLQDVIVNELVGSEWLTVLLGLVVVWYLSIKAKMPIQVSIIFCLLWLVVMFAGYSTGGDFLIIWVYVVLFIGVFFT